MHTIAVYGSASVKPGDAAYQDAYAVGQALGKAGYAVMTGGYAGVMAAASRGAHETGGHVIGVTSLRLEELRNGTIQVNEWVADEIRQATMRERLLHLVLEADGYVVMPGGLGTLTELTVVWELLRAGDIPRRPFVCYGPYWREMLAGFQENPYVRDDSWDVMAFADTPEATVATIDRHFAGVVE